MGLRAALLMTMLLAGTAAAQDPPRADMLFGIVRDAAGKPAAGVEIDILRRPAEGFICLDLPYAWRTDRVQRTRTGKLGTFAVQLPRGVPFIVRVADGVHAPVHEAGVYAGVEIELHLRPPAGVAVRLRHPDGSPAAGGRLEGWVGSERLFRGEFDARGEFRAAGLPVCTLRLKIQPDSGRRTTWQGRLEAGVNQPIDLVVEPGVVLRGRVTDRSTGAPIQGARVGEGWTMAKSVLTDADGRYEMLGYGASGYNEIHVRAPNHGVQKIGTEADLAGDLIRDFALVPARVATGRILRSDGEPAAGVYVAAIAYDRGPNGTFDWSSGVTDDDGRYRLTALRHDQVHALMVRAEGAATLIADMPAFGDAGSLALTDLRLRTARYLTGTVKLATGGSIERVRVNLRGCNFDRAELLSPLTPMPDSTADIYLKRRRARPDGLGRFHFADLPAGQYDLEFVDGGKRFQCEVVVPTDGDPEPLSITLPW